MRIDEADHWIYRTGPPTAVTQANTAAQTLTRFSFDCEWWERCRWPGCASIGAACGQSLLARVFFALTSRQRQCTPSYNVTPTA